MNNIVLSNKETLEEDKFFDFEKEKTQQITLNQLERTYRENDVYGNPLKGIYHYDLFNRVISECEELGYNVEVYDIYTLSLHDALPISEIEHNPVL